MKKYWKRINEGWKRIHYVLSVIFSLLLFLNPMFGANNPAEIALIVLLILLFLLLYFLIVISIEWIKEGFDKD